MSKLITNTIRHTGGSADNITLDNSQNVTVEGNATVDGTSTLTGNVTCSGQLKTDAIRHTGASSDAITLANDGTATAKITGGITQGLSNSNMITNGEMLVKQRPGDISFAHDGTRVGNVVDCFKFSMTTCDSYDCTVSHANSGPVTDAGGFSKSFKVTTGTAESAIAVSEYSYIDTRLEGWDCQRLYYGDANAKAATLSFWV